jgi:hypothetical protein
MSKDKNTTDTAPKDSGPSGTDVAIAVGTTVGAGATIGLAAVSAYPMLKDAGSALVSGAKYLKNFFGKAEGAVTSTMEDAANVALSALGKTGLNARDAEQVVEDAMNLGKTATVGEFETLIKTALRKGGQIVETDTVEVAADALKAALNVIL